MAKFIEIDDREMREWEARLKGFEDVGLKIAMQRTTNGMAFAAMRIAKKRLQTDFVLRNKWTERSVRVNPIKGLRSEAMRRGAETGTTEQYLALQEFGGLLKSKGKHGYPVPTPLASREAEGTQPRKRPRSRPHRLGTIKIRRTAVAGKSRSQRNFLAVREAAMAKRRFVALETNRGHGIFKITKFGGKTGKKAEVKLLYDLSRRTRRIPAKPWLFPSAKLAVKRGPGIYKKEIRKQLQRRRVAVRK